MKDVVAKIRAFGARLGSRVHRNAKSGWKFWRTWARAVYLPDEVNIYGDSCIRLIFCFYQIPSIIFVMCVTHSALERVVWVLVVPVTQEMERNPYHFSSFQTLGVGLSSIALKIAPFAALGISFATFGHKALNCFVEAMLDAYTTHKDKDYPLLHARLQFVLEKRSRIYTALAVMVMVAVSIVCVFQQHTISFLSRDEPHVLLAAAIVVVIQIIFMLTTVITGAPKDIVDVFTDRIASAAGMITSLGSPSKWSAGSNANRSGSDSTRARRGRRGGEGRDGQGQAPPSFESASMASSTARGPLPPDNQATGGGTRARLASPNDDSGPPSPHAHTRSREPTSPSVLTSPGSSLTNKSMAGFDPPDVTSNMVHFFTYFLGDWWTHNIQYMRYIAFVSAALFGVAVAQTGGPIQGLTSAVLLILCLNFPHLFGYLSLTITSSAIRTERSFYWLWRHRDAFLPVLVVDLPYQAVLLNAMYHFHRYPRTCAPLLAVNVLLVARVIDLVREYDVSEHGSVHWEDARRYNTHAHALSSPHHRHQAPLSPRGAAAAPDGDDSATESETPSPGYTPKRDPRDHYDGLRPHHLRIPGAGRKQEKGPFEKVAAVAAPEAGDEGSACELVAPSLAIILEDAYEKHQQRPGLVSLDMTVDIKHMRIRYADKKKKDVALARHQIIPYGAARRYLRDRNFYGYVLPRLLSLQSPGYFAGAAYRTARVILRVISITALFLFTLIVFGMIVQAAFPQLRSIAVRVTSPPDQSFLTVDHVVLRMHLIAANADSGGAAAATAAAEPQQHAGGKEGDEGDKEDEEAALAEEGKSAVPEGSAPDAAHAVFQWSNVTSPAGEDFYPHLCRRDYHGTSVWELSLLALAPYLFNLDEVQMLVDFMNRHLDSDWVIKPRHGTSCVATDSAHSPTGWSGFYDFYSAKRDMSVLSLRGTDLFSFMDFLIDINLFFESVLYQVMTFVVPGSIVVPKELVVNMIRTVSLRSSDEPEEDVDNIDSVYGVAKARSTWAALVQSTNTSARRCQQNNYHRDFYVDVQNHLTHAALQTDGSRPKHVVLTGHSLGGAVAAIVAARMELEAVVFSAPGIALALKKFNVDLRSIHKNVMTVVSTNDIVPLVGAQGGELHHVECLAVKREMCHAMEFMVGSLWRSCSSVRDRFPAIADIA